MNIWRNLTAANQLTILRMLLIPVFVILLVYGYRGWALVSFIVAGITDLLDGLIARDGRAEDHARRLARSDGGQAAAGHDVRGADAAGLGLANRLPLWFTVLVISRDVAIVLTVAVVNLAVGPRTFRPSIYGKIATATFILTGVVALYFNYLEQTSALVTLFVYASLAITVVSALPLRLQMLTLPASSWADAASAWIQTGAPCGSRSAVTPSS